MQTNYIQSGDNQLEIIADAKDLVIIERQFTGHTALDKEIHAQPIPASPMWLNITVRIIRSYQKNISPGLGNRCVFNPSCSHYSELAFRKKGFLRGMQLTVKRLCRCRSSNGGTDTIV